MIDVLQFNEHMVTPRDDALLYDFIINSCGVFEGCSVTHLGSNQLRVASGRGIIKGRIFVIEEETILAALSASGAQKGRLLVRIDISNTEIPIQFITQVSGALPSLVQQDINRDGTIYELPLATYDVDTMQISNLVNAPNPIVLKSDISASVPWAGITGKPSAFTPSAHQHAAGDVTSGILPVARGGTGAGDAAAARANLGAAPTSHTHVWANITNPPATYAPSAHNQAANTITAGTFPGAVVAQANANYTTPQIRNVVFYPKASYPNGVGLPALPDGTIALLFE